MPVVSLPKGLSANNLQVSPWDPSELVVSAASNFGITGGGGVFIVRAPQVGHPSGAGLPPVPITQVVGHLPVPGSGVVDAAFCETTEGLVVAGCADGGVLVCRLARGTPPAVVGQLPHAHRADVSSLAWNPSRPNLFATGSWDRGVRIFDMTRVAAADPAGTVGVLSSAQYGGLTGPPLARTGGQLLPPPTGAELSSGGHLSEVFEVSWCPRQPHLLASVGGDGSLKVWDMRVSFTPAPAAQPSLQDTARGGRPAVTVEAAHGVGRDGHRRNQLMTMSWNFYEPFICATGGTDNAINVWDLRKVSGVQSRPLVHLHSGHQAPVKRVRFSPHHRTCLLSGGYDFRVCMWNLDHKGGAGPAGQSATFLQYRHEHHREYVTGVGWGSNPSDPLQVASCSWDGTVALWRLGSQLRP